VSPRRGWFYAGAWRLSYTPWDGLPLPVYAFLPKVGLRRPGFSVMPKPLVTAVISFWRWLLRITPVLRHSTFGALTLRLTSAKFVPVRGSSPKVQRRIFRFAWGWGYAVNACLLCGAWICGGPLDFQTSAGGRSCRPFSYLWSAVTEALRFFEGASPRCTPLRVARTLPFYCRQPLSFQGSSTYVRFPPGSIRLIRRYNSL
jgi:hypothetical protein